MEGKEVEVVIDSEEMADYLFTELIARGFSPSEEELEEIADVVFDYLIDKAIISEEDDEEDFG